MIEKVLKTVFQSLIKGYAFFISPWLGNRCRFHPSCSVYATQAIEEHGVIKGFYLGVKRILKCGPWNPGGYDPVPEKDRK
jgi:hypothetical protein